MYERNLFIDNDDEVKQEVKQETKTYLNVPFNSKDEAKKLNAKWDSNVKKWYAPNNEKALIDKWGINKKQEIKEVKKTSNKLYINVLFNEKDDAKKLGCLFDKDKGKWYYYEDNKNKKIINDKYGKYIEENENKLKIIELLRLIINKIYDEHNVKYDDTKPILFKC